MGRKKKVGTSENKTEIKGKMTINIGELYKYSAEDLCPDITVVRYSNLAYIQVTPRDVQIDFLEMPGIKKDSKMMVNGTRIYMSHAAAQKLSEALVGLLQQVHDHGGIEQYCNGKKRNNPK
jgi:hypothetical protein